MLRRWFQSIFVKFSLSFIVVGLIPLVAISIFSVQTYTSHLHKHTVNNVEQMLQYLGLTVGSTFAEYNEITKLMYFGNNEGSINELDQILSRSEEDPKWMVQRQIDDYLKRLLFSDRNIRNIYFIRKADGEIYYQSRGTTLLQPGLLSLQEWLRPLAAQPKQLAVIPTHPQPYFPGVETTVVTLGRNLIDTSGSVSDEDVAVLGTLFVDIDTRVFQEMTADLRLNEKDLLYILDKQGNVFYSNDGELSYPANVNVLADEETLVFSETISFQDGRVVAALDRGQLFRQLNQTQVAAWAAIAICSTVLFVLSVLFSRRLSTPILEIMKQMTKVESGNLGTKIAVTSHDEIGRLANGFNRMVERLSSFIEVAYIAEIKQKQTELNALKSQIRPHYLYNTLEVIRMNAVANDDTEVGDMIHSLSKQLQYVIDYGEDRVSLERELAHLQDYFFIIQVRYEGRIELRLVVSDDVDMEWLILKLSLQPIVENAIQHGIRPKGGKGVVQVSVENQDGKLAVTVYDDGVGMDEAKLEAVIAQIEKSNQGSRGVGMSNVQERMKSLYGEGFGMDISSKAHVGTSIRLLFPIQRRSKDL